MEMTFSEQLKQAGLTPHQAAIYETLLKGGAMPARKATLESGVHRTLGYAVLEQLIELGLVKKDASPVAKFSASHPNVLQERIENAAKSAERAAIALKGALPDLASAFNLATGKPGIQFFEGAEGQRETLWDSLTSKETIYTYVDVETVDAYVDELNKEYVRERLKRKIPKYILTPETPQSRAMLRGETNQYTEWRLLRGDAPLLNCAMHIYDGKISYQTFTKDSMTGTIMRDSAMYALHRYLFEQQWKGAISSTG